MRRTIVILLLLGCLLAPAGAAGPDPRAVGDGAWDRGDWPAALVAWSDALSQARQARDVEAERDLLLRLAGAHRELGRVDVAKEVLDLARELAQSEVAKADVALAEGLLARHVGDLDRAATRLRDAFVGYRGGGEPRGAANAALNLAVARLELGQLSDAEKALDGASTLFHVLGDDSGEADVFVNRALVDRRRGDPRRARAHLQQAERLYERSGDATGVADVRTNLAGVEASLGRPEIATRHLEAALEIARERKDLMRQGALRYQLGGLAWQAGRPDVAAGHLKAAESAYAESGRAGEAVRVAVVRAFVDPPDAAGLAALVARARDHADPRIEADARVRAARLLLESDPKAAVGHAKAALKLATRLELPEVRWQALYVLGRQARADGDLDGAASTLGEAVGILERRRRLLDTHDADLFADQHEPVYHALAEVHLARGEPLHALAATERLALTEQPLDAASTDGIALENLAAREAWL